jgi:DNA repair protein RecO
MERSITVQAVVIGTRKAGEINREITLLCSDLGIIRVLIYGGQKSLKALKPPLFSIGSFFLTAGRAEGKYTLSDVRYEASCPFEFDLGQVGIASFFAELAQIAGGSDPSQAFPLIREALERLSLAADETQRNIILIQYVWQLFKIAGIVADPAVCPICGKTYGAKEISYFSTSINFFCCEACADCKSLFIGPGARKYLALTYPMSFEEALDIPLLPSTALRMRRIMITYSMHVSGHMLRTVQSSMV